MRTHEIIDRLCFDGEGSPYPLEALYTLEGLQYVELVQLLRSVEKGDPLPPWDELAGAERRRMAKALGASKPEDEVELARAAGAALDVVKKQARRIGVAVPAASRSELLQIVGQMCAAKQTWRTDDSQALNAECHNLVVVAARLIEAVDHFALGQTRGVDRLTESTGPGEDW